MTPGARLAMMAGVKWYDRPLRIAALKCNYEDGRNLDVVDRWVEAGFNTEQLFHPMADAYSPDSTPLWRDATWI